MLICNMVYFLRYGYLKFFVVRPSEKKAAACGLFFRQPVFRRPFCFQVAQLFRQLAPLVLFHRFAVLDVVDEFVAVVLHEAPHGEDGGISEGADGAAGHVVADAL